MIFDTFMQLLPILLLTTGGYVMGKIYPLNLDTLVMVAADFLMPMLIFYALYKSDLEGALILDIVGATTLIIALLALLAYIYTRLAKIDARPFLPAVLFTNGGFLGIPLMKLWGGMTAMNLIVIYDQIQTVYIFTIGVLIITGGFTMKSLRSIVKSPILWSIIAGSLFRYFNIPVPEAILTTLDFGGNAGPPLAAFTLGLSLHATSFKINRHIIAGMCFRVIGGFLFGVLATSLFGLTGVSRTVVIVAATLPSAIFTSILPLRYGLRSDFAGTLVVVSTILGVVTIPLVFWLAGL
jgi:hypothetical protein